MAKIYRIRVRRGDYEVEVESSEKDYVEAQLKEHLEQGPVAPSAEQPHLGPVQTGGSEKPLSLREFLDAVRPRVDTEYVLALTYFCEKYEGQPAVASADVKRKFGEMKYQHSNPYYAVSRAKKNGFIMVGPEKGLFVTTRKGEQWVEDRLRESKED